MSKAGSGEWKFCMQVRLMVASHVDSSSGDSLLLLLLDHARIRQPLGSSIRATKKHVTAPALLSLAICPTSSAQEVRHFGLFIVPNSPIHDIEGSTIKIRLQYAMQYHLGRSLWHPIIKAIRTRFQQAFLVPASGFLRIIDS